MASFAQPAAEGSRYASVIARRQRRMVPVIGYWVPTRYRGDPRLAVDVIAQPMSASRVGGCQTFAYFIKSPVSSGYVAAR